MSKRKSTESASSLPSGFHQTRPTATKPARLDLGVAAFEQRSEKQQVQQSQSQPQQSEKPRLGTVRSASERPRATQDRPLRLREMEQVDRRSFVEDHYRSRPVLQEQQNPQPEQLQPSSYQRRSRSFAQRPVSIEEEEEEEREDADLSSSSSHSALAFEIIPPRSQHRHRSRSRAQSSRRPEIRKVRAKVYGEADTRYVMIAADIHFSEFVEQVRAKFGLKNGFKLKMKDEEGDMVTMGDQEDFEMAIATCVKTARQEMVDLGKIDVSTLLAKKLN